MKSRCTVFEVKNLDQVKEYLIEKGVKLIANQPTPGYKHFFLFDFWHNRIEFMVKI